MGLLCTLCLKGSRAAKKSGWGKMTGSFAPLSNVPLLVAAAQHPDFIFMHGVSSAGKWTI